MNLASLLDLPSMIVPDTTVIVDGDREVGYFELRSASAQVAGLLRSLGVEANDRVGIFATNQVEVLEVLFGAAAVGATSVPMNYRAGVDEASHLLSDSGTKVLFAETRYRGLIDSVKPEGLEHIYYFDDGSYAAARDGAEPDELVDDVEDTQLAVLLYTSGTTSLPKGVMLTHEALTGYVMGANDAADGEEHGRMLLAAPIYHIAGMTSTLNALYSGRVTVLLSQFQTDAWLAAVPRYRITHAFLVPTMIARLLDDPGLSGADLSTLEAITYGAAPMPPPVIRRAIDLFPRTVAFAGSYGQTETTSTVAVLDPDDHRIWEGSPEEQERKLRRLRSVGQVLEDVQVKVMSPDGEDLGTDQPGEVWLSTFRKMEGYWGAKEKTRVTIDDEGWIHTGDMGYLDADGYLFLVGRAGDMIIRGGENIAPDEVEAVLYEHPDVLEAAVVGVPDEEWGERVVASVVLREGGADTEGLMDHCRKHLASFKRPERIVVMEELPRTSTGKLLRRDLIPVLSDEA
ncbi:MAG: AMP-binding protein [Acidimicrobiia bacterium]|nr:AMP-binding protein [Acidimicrobiia bacterium]